MSDLKIPADPAYVCGSAACALAEANVALERARRTLLRHKPLAEQAATAGRLRDAVDAAADELLGIARLLREDM